MNFGANGGAVDIGNARLDVSHGPKRSRDVPSIDRAGKPIRSSVEDFNRLFEVFNLYDRKNRTENFLPRDAHGGGHLVEYRRFIEIAVDPLAFFIESSADQQPGSLLLANLDITVNALSGGFVD